LLSSLIECHYHYQHGGGGRQYQRQQQQRPKKVRPECYYKTLGLPKGTDAKTVKKTFKKLALKMHPDKVAESEREEAKEKFELITNAYTILNDPNKKSAYDRGGFDGIDEWQENESHKEQRNAQQEQYAERQKEQEKHQNLFEESEVSNLDISFMTSFYRRINVWLI